MRINKISQKENFVEALLERLEKELPAVFARRAIPKLFGEALTVGTMANLGKTGPPFVKIGKHAMYERESFLAWFRLRMK